MSGSQQTSEQDAQDRVWSLIKEISIAMVVTHDGHGDHLRARPMAARASSSGWRRIWVESRAERSG